MKLAFFEAPAQEKEEKFEKEKKIKEIFGMVGISIEDQKEIFGRIVEMHMEENSHFSDAVEIMCMVEKVFEKIGGETEKEKVMLAALLHDIGKSGPEEADGFVRETIQQLFAKDAERKYGINDFANKTVRESVEKIYPREAGKRLEALVSCGIDSDLSMREFFGMHVDWTYDILKNNENEKIDDAVITIASTHHILEGKNPAHIEMIPEEAKFLEIMDKYQFLTLLDKYQAFRKRSGMEHEEAIEKIKEKINSSKVSEKEKNGYLHAIDLIFSSKDALESARENAKKILE